MILKTENEVDADDSTFNCLEKNTAMSVAKECKSLINAMDHLLESISREHGRLKMKLERIIRQTKI